MSVQFHYAARTDVGLVRSNNQDSGYAGQRLLVLADGMGGPAGGDIASSVAVAHLAPLDDDVPAASDLLPLLRQSVDAAQAELMERSRQDSELAGLGTTLIAILRSNNKLGMVHIGDSRAYLLRDGLLTQVTSDHTYVQHLVDTGRITPEEAEVHPNRNMILRALGDTSGELILDESLREAIPGDRWLLCSDGLSGMVAHETIEETLRTVADPGECADQLVDLALRGGGTDNVTVVVCDVHATDELSPGTSLPTVPQIVGAAANKAFAKSRAGHGNNTSAAERAASLAPRILPEPEDETPARKRRLGPILAVFAVLGIVAGGIWAAYSWTQTRYYVVADDEGWVTIYQGIPQTLGPINLSEPFERTDIRVDELSGLARTRLDTPITRASLAEAEAVVETLREEIVTTAPPAALTGTDATTSPSPSPSTGTP